MMIINVILVCYFSNDFVITYLCKKHKQVNITCMFNLGVFLYQFTEEKLGQAEKTELDAHLENLLTRAECTKHWTEKILKQTEVLLQPNPSKI